MEKVDGVDPVIFSLEKAEDGEILFCFIADNNNPHAFDWEDFKNRGICPKKCATFNVDEATERCGQIQTTRDFWTCKCEKGFVHHCKTFICTKCHTNKHQSTKRLKLVENTLGWHFH